MSSPKSPSELAGSVSISEAQPQPEVFELVAHEALVIIVCLLAFLWSRRFLGNRKASKCKMIPSKQPQQTVASVAIIRNTSDASMHNSDLSSWTRTLEATPVALAPTPRARAMEQQIIKLLSQREFTRALNMYRACERDGQDHHFVSEAFFSDFIQSAARVGKVDVAERLLRTMHRNGIQPSLTFWQTNLKLLSSRKHFSTLLAAYSIFDKCIPADKVVYSCLVNAALDCEQASVAAHMLECYSESCLQPKDFVLHFRTYAALADADAAEALFRRLAKDKVASTLMLNLTILAFVNSCKTQRAEALLADIEAAQLGLVDAVSYNTLIKGFAQMGDTKRCFDCLRTMRARGTKPDDVTLTSLVDVWTREGDTDEASARLAELLTGTDGGDAPTCALLIRGLVRTGSLAKALEVYKGMQARLCDSSHCFDLSTYSILIKACVESHDLEKALQLVVDLQEAGLQPDDIVLTHLLDGCRHAGDHKLGRGLFTELVSAGVQPSEYTLIAMLKLHGRCGMHREAHDLVESWERTFNMKPSVIHYTCLMSGCLRTKSYDQAWAAYDLMCATGTQPDKLTLSTLIPGVAAACQWDRVLTLAQQAIKDSATISLPAEVWNNALRQMQAGSSGRHAAQLEALMRGAGVPIASPRRSPAAVQ